jgi:hypothetical protein
MADENPNPTILAKRPGSDRGRPLSVNQPIAGIEKRKAEPLFLAKHSMRGKIMKEEEPK